MTTVDDATAPAEPPPSPSTMAAGDRVYAIACCAIIGWCLAYALADWASWPRLHYFPYERDWRMAIKPGPVPMGYVGLILWGLGGAACGAALATAAAALWRRPLPGGAVPLLGAWALTAFVFTGTYFMWNLWPF